MNLDEARAVLREHGQEHLLKYYDQLSPQEREVLLNQIAGINFSVFHALDAGGERKIGKLSPVPAVTVHDVELRRAEFEDIGLAAIRAGKVAAVLLAGGQGTRLGSDNPKGMFNIGVTRELSIFEQQFVNISEVTRKAGACFHIFIMTSEVNNSATVQFFRQKNFFGYPPEKVHFFVQEMAPACDLNGKILLEDKGKIAMSPNGNGGWYAAFTFTLPRNPLIGSLSAEIGPTSIIWGANFCVAWRLPLPPRVSSIQEPVCRGVGR